MPKLHRCQETCGHARGRFVGVAKEGAPVFQGWRQSRGWFVCPVCGRMWTALIAVYRVRRAAARALVPVIAARWLIDWSFVLTGVVEVIR